MGCLYGDAHAIKNDHLITQQYHLAKRRTFCVLRGSIQRLNTQQRGSEHRLPRQLLQLLVGRVLLQVGDGHSVLVGEHAQINQTAPLQPGLLDVAMNELCLWLVLCSAVVLRPHDGGDSVRIHNATLPPKQLGVLEPLPPHLKQNIVLLERQHRDESVPLHRTVRRQEYGKVCPPRTQRKVA
jgi:hypothetical protein